MLKHLFASKNISVSHNQNHPKARLVNKLLIVLFMLLFHFSSLIKCKPPKNSINNVVWWEFEAFFMSSTRPYLLLSLGVFFFLLHIF